MSSDQEFMLIGKKKIRVDSDNFVSLSDIHTASGKRTKQTPNEWYILTATHTAMKRVYEKEVGEITKGKTFKMSKVLKTPQSSGSGFWALPNLALDYAYYLSPELAYEVRDVFIRYKTADPKLADELLERASDQENTWTAARAVGRVQRNRLVKTYNEHGVTGNKIAGCTNGLYRGLYGLTAKQLREVKKIDESAAVRDGLDVDDLTMIAMGEMMARQKIEDHNLQGGSQCYHATKDSGFLVRDMVKLNSITAPKNAK